MAIHVNLFVKKQKIIPDLLFNKQPLEVFHTGREEGRDKYFNIDSKLFEMQL